MRMLSFALACLLPAAFSASAHAHAVKLWATVEGDRAKVIVTEPDGTPVAEGVTNSDGLFFFTPARKADLLIKIDAGMGHCAEYTLGADELEGLDMAATAAEGTEVNQTPPASKESVAILKKMNARLAGIEKKLNRLLQPDDATRWQDIIAGVGYILGLAGITMYFMAGRKRRGQ